MSLVTRTLLSISRLSRQASILFGYIAASTLTLAEMKDGIRRSWENYCSRDEEISGGLMDWEKDLVGRFIRPGASVLVVGAGSGRDLIPLAEQGCRLTGVEPAAAALARARRAFNDRHLPVTLVEGFFEDALVDGVFDVIVFSFYSYSYVPESRRRVAALRKASAHLAANGRVLISYPAMRPPRPILVRVGRIVGGLFGSDWRLEPGDVINVEGGAFFSFSHAFEPGELDAEAVAAGLSVIYRRDYPDPVRALAASTSASSPQS